MSEALGKGEIEALPLRSHPLLSLQSTLLHLPSDIDQRVTAVGKQTPY